MPASPLCKQGNPAATEFTVDPHWMRWEWSWLGNSDDHTLWDKNIWQLLEVFIHGDDKLCQNWLLIPFAVCLGSVMQTHVCAHTEPSRNMLYSSP